MDRITYRKTLDVHKNGIQCVLQGFETADKMSRVIEIGLMASGDAIDFPLEKLIAVMYVTTPGATEPSINKCTIKDNKIIYEALPIVEEGITTMQIKLIEASVDGATRVLAAPKFAVEVVESETDDEDAEQSTTFTALEDAMAKAKAVYDERFIRMELTSDCIFRAYYADGTYYETDVLKRLFNNGNVLLSESYAKGGTGVRAGEDTDNSKYYSNVSRSEALKAKDIMENSEDILEEVRLHGVYTAFSVDFTTGEVEYVSPNSEFKVNMETGELEVIGQTYTFNDEVGRVVREWLEANKVRIDELQNLADRITPIDKGGTNAETVEEARNNLSVFSKDELCDNDTLSLYGLSSESSPKEILNMLGNSELFYRKHFRVGTYVGTGTVTIPNTFNPMPSIIFIGSNVVINCETESISVMTSASGVSNKIEDVTITSSNKITVPDSVYKNVNTLDKTYHYIALG